MPPLGPPELSTLEQTPSWLNAHGHVDRSACIEVRVGELRRKLLGCAQIVYGRAVKKGRSNRRITPLPDEKPARNGRGRIATGVCIINRDDLDYLQGWRLPRELAGDRRTARAPAMSDFQPHARPKRIKTRGKRNTPYISIINAKLDANPNKGAARSKKLCLPTAWHHALRIEKWIAGKRHLPEYFLICPGSHSRIVHHGEHEDHGERKKVKSTQKQNPSSALSAPPFSVVNPAPLSTRKPGREKPSTKHCPQRVRKLLMVMCTQREMADAVIAQTWIDNLPYHLRKRDPYFSHIQRIITRYGLLFHPRVLLCQRCLGAHYGNDPEHNRQQWRRAHGKRPPTSHELAEAMKEPETHFTRYRRELAELVSQTRSARKRRNPRTRRRSKKHALAELEALDAQWQAAATPEKAWKVIEKILKQQKGGLMTLISDL